jgi:hypothetical protein
MNYAKYGITIDASLAAALAANLPNAALLSAGHTQAQIDALRAELTRAAVAFRESDSPSTKTSTVGTTTGPSWQVRHGYDQKAR